MALVAIAWVVAYYVRFEVLRPMEWVPFSRYANFIPWVLAVSALVFWSTGLYQPDRAQRLPLLIFSVAKSVAFGLIVVAASLSFYRTFSFSRLHMILFGVATPVLLILLRVVLYTIRRRARLQGKYLKRVLIIGAGRAGRMLESAFRQYPWMGFDVVGFLDDEKTQLPDVLGRVEEVGPLSARFEEEGKPLDYVYIALPLSASSRVPAILEELSTRLAHVCVVPDLFQLDILNSRVTDVNGLPVIHLIDEAPIEARRFMKRAIDVIFSTVVLLIAAPLMLLIALGVKLSSPGPVFYRQERMSLNGKRFQMLKFRSMPVNAESETGPVWAKPGEQRATLFGAFLRRTSLDELPQFITCRSWVHAPNVRSSSRSSANTCQAICFVTR